MKYDNPKAVIATRKHYQIMISRMVQELTNPDIVLNKIGKRQEALDDLKYDAHVASCIQSRKSGVKSLQWEINRGGTKTSEVLFIEQIFNNLPLIDIFNDILDAPYYGVKFLEIYWQYQDGKIIPVDILGKPTYWFFFDQNNIARFRQFDVKDGVPLPKRKFFIVQHNATYDNPYGEALLSKCYWPVFYKKEIVKFWATFCEKFGMPYLHGNLPEGSSPEELEEMRDSLEDMRQDGNIVTQGDGNMVSLLDASKSGSPALYEQFIQFFNTEISKAILSQTLTTEQTGKTGSYSMSKTHAEVRQDVIDADKRLVGNCMNDLIKWIMEYNFNGIKDMPKFEFYFEEDVDKELADRDAALAGTGQIKFTKNYFMRNYGFKDDEIEIIDNPQNPQAGGFAEVDSPEDPAQSGLDNMNNVALNDLGKASDELLQQVLKLIDEGSSYDEIESQLISLLPDLDTKAIEDLIARGIIVANAGGQISAAK